MLIKPKSLALALCPILLGCLLAVAQKSGNENQWKAVDDAMGRSGQDQPDGAHKYGLPRGDMKVIVAGVEVKPVLALGSWVAFSKPGSDSMVMGDLVLAEDEVEPVMMSLENSGVQVTALHNHVLRESPRVMYMHIAGHGDGVKLAGAIKEAIGLTKTPPQSSRNRAPGHRH